MTKSRIDRFIEKNGGLITSACIFAAFFAILIARTIPIIKSDEQLTFSVNLNLSAKEDNNVPPATLPELSFESARRTVPGDSNDDNPQDQSVSDIPVAEYQNPISQQELSEMNGKLSSAKLSIAAEKSDIQRWVEKQDMTERGRDHLAETDGKSHGVIRTLTFKDFPKSIINIVLEKYRIRITTKYINSNSDFTYLNQAEVSPGEIYYSKKGEGMYEVFELSPTSIMKMTTLELEELKKRNLDRTKTRIREIHFGIIKNAKDEYDLGIVKFVYDQIM